jgi:peptidase E
MQHIITMGGGGFSMEPDNLALDRFVIAQTGKDRPKISFLGQASAESQVYIINFFKAFTALDCQPSFLSLFQPHTTDIEGYLMAQDIIYVGGGNTKSMLALWREWGLDKILLQAANNGTVLAGISAGALCWYEMGTTDSYGDGTLRPLNCLGYLKGSFSPHYDGEANRRPVFHDLVASGAMLPGIAMDDGAAAHFIDGELHEVVSSRPHAKGYRIVREGDKAIETELATRYLL